MEKIFEKLKKFDYRHFLTFIIIIGAFLISVFLFPNAYVRIWECFTDLWNSICYYFCELLDINAGFSPTVLEKSSVDYKPIFNFPENWQDFSNSWNAYWSIFISGENFSAYVEGFGNFLYYFSQILLLIILPFFIILYLVFQSYISKENNNYNKTSKTLKGFQKFSAKVYTPIKYWLSSFKNFICIDNLHYKKIFIFIFLLTFNFIAIFIEFFAYYFVFVVSFDLGSVFIQIYKLFCDLSVVINFFPLPVWIVFGWLFIVWLRKKIAYKRLRHFEAKNCGYINKLPIVTMICGTMGKKKTTLLTDIALSQEIIFRDKAFELLQQNDFKFPNFPWINFENAIKQAIKTHKIFNLASARKYVDELEKMFCLGFFAKDKANYKSVKRQYKKRFNLRFKNLCFDYDYQRYGLEFDDKLKIVTLFDVLKNYAQLYFIYIIESALIVSNYSTRTDNLKNDIGNFPMWNNDFFERDSKLIPIESKFSHIIDFDALRLGKKVIENNEYANSFDFGVVLVTEIGKERKNNLQLNETKIKEFRANQKNDGFNSYLKMCRHSATVDNFPFIKFITDEQRPESLGADARDLCDIVHINEAEEIKIAMPFFFVSELIYGLIIQKFIDFYYQYRFVRADNTLFMHVLKTITTKFYNYYLRNYNLFGVSTLKTTLENGKLDGKLDDKKYYLMSKKIYSERFSTDCFSDYFAEKTINSKYGLNDMPTYKNVKATFEELKKQNSYFVKDLLGEEKENEEEKYKK